MANPTFSRGADPKTTQNGGELRQGLTLGIDTGDATAILKNSVIKQDADGKASLCAAGETMRGIAQCFQNADGEPVKYRLASIAGTVQYVAAEDVLFEMREDSDGGALAVTAEGAFVDLVAGTADTGAGVSGDMLDSSTLSTSAGQIQLVRLVEAADNVVGTTALWLCRFNPAELQVGV